MREGAVNYSCKEQVSPSSSPKGINIGNRLLGNRLLGNSVHVTQGLQSLVLCSHTSQRGLLATWKRGTTEDEMPKRANYLLIWSHFRQVYELHEGEQGSVLDVKSDSFSLEMWLEQHFSFSFRGQNGFFRARKEFYKGRGEGYWYAYARIKGKLTKRYLGRSNVLTLAHLEQVAQLLWCDTQPTPQRGGKKTPIITYAEGPSLSDTRCQGNAIILLASKLHAPPPRPHLLHRPRLLQRLQRGLTKSLLLLSAPAGFGKSTLISDWLAACTIPVAWLTLEPRDNDPLRFLTYVLSALQATDPGLSKVIQNLPHPLHRASPEQVLASLIHGLETDIDEKQQHIVLVLDDYHVITNGSIHYALSFLLEHLPPQLHIVISTREDPPLPLARLRGRDNLLELRATDLRFTDEEATAYLVEKMKLPLSEEECSLLLARTEGWITGLYLAALALQDCRNPFTFIATFSGSHPYIMDYLLEEVLNRQPQAIQDFLLQTSLLDRLNASLCNAVRLQNDSQTQLAFLERSNLFLIPLDDERCWYRYHHLFAEALRQRLQQTTPELIPILRLRASNWFEQHGLLTDDKTTLPSLPGWAHQLGLERDYTARLLATGQTRFVEHQLHVSQDGLLMEPLTPREREVLQILVEGASNQEIARRLVLSVNTVKKHVLNIYGKLNVQNRAQAIARAWEIDQH
jgi:LuxR family maltose regulon positive regulatory protein